RGRRRGRLGAGREHELRDPALPHRDAGPRLRGRHRRQLARRRAELRRRLHGRPADRPVAVGRAVRGHGGGAARLDPRQFVPEHPDAGPPGRSDQGVADGAVTRSPNSPLPETFTVRPVPPDSLPPGPVGRYRWTICALLFFATTINYVDRQVISLLK